MKFILIYPKYYDKEKDCISVGGIQNYLSELATLITTLGYEVFLFQRAKITFQKKLPYINIQGICTADNIKPNDVNIFLFHHAMKIYREGDILIFMADHCSVKNNVKSLLIQHGVHWDLPNSFLTTRRWLKTGVLAKLKRYLYLHQAAKSFYNCKYRVCVDYNYINWIKTIYEKKMCGKNWVIPNFASTIIQSTKEISPPTANEPVRILFARRFTDYRGVSLMLSAVQLLNDRRVPATFTFAGEGPDENKIISAATTNSNINLIKYKHSEVDLVLANHDISVVPSLGSEGTSLAVAEAMAAGRVVVATAVGGITNMILSEFNGILVQPAVEDLADAIESIVYDIDKRKELSKNAYSTAMSVFSVTKWRERWTDVFDEISK